MKDISGYVMFFFCCHIVMKRIILYILVCLRNSIEMHVVLLAILLHCYFTQSPSRIMTGSNKKAWYRIAHGKVTSWLFISLF